MYALIRFLKFVYLRRFANSTTLFVGSVAITEVVILFF